jgi:hypothetical protein
MSAAPIDRERVERLAAELGGHVRAELARPPLSRDNVLVTLNALAFCVATVIAATDEDDPTARRFFDDALTQNLAQTRDELNKGRG